MIKTCINHISYKEYDKFECSQLNFLNEKPVIKFLIKGDGRGHEEVKDSRASKSALLKYISDLEEQKRLAGIYLNKINEIENGEVKFGKNSYIVL